MMSWECAVCGHIHQADQAPKICPICGAPQDRFVGREIKTSPSANISGKRIAVIGAGIAGFSAAQTLRQLSADSEIHLYNDEADLPYVRMNLTRVLAGELTQADLPLQSAAWYKEQRIVLHSPCRVSHVDAAKKEIHDDQGQNLAYDKLILCSGARAHVPDLFAAHGPKVLTLLSLADLRRLLKLTSTPKDIFCLGGGVLGVECAAALAARGHRVTLVYSGRQLMPRQLDLDASHWLESALKKHSVALLPHAHVKYFCDTDRPMLTLADGRILQTDLLLLCTGVHPCLPSFDPPLPKPVAIDPAMSTCLGDILACGDVTILNGLAYGSWGPAQLQGQAAARSALGLDSGFVAPLPSCLVKVVRPEILTIGRVMPECDILIRQNRPDFHIALTVNKHSLCGAILINASEYAAIVNRAISGSWNLDNLLRQGLSARDFLGKLQESHPA